MTKKERREKAQDILMHELGNGLGYWQERHADVAESMTDEEKQAFRAELQKQADRVAKLFGFEKAWSN